MKNHLVVCKFVLKKQRGLQKPAMPIDQTERGNPGGQRSKKDLYRHRIALVPRPPGMHSGCRGGVEDVHNSCDFTCYSGKRTEMTRIANNGKK